MSQSTASGDLHLGVEEVDREHGLQVELVDELEKASTPAEATRVAEQLEQATQLHFIGEEVLMRQHSYPLYHAHIQEHARVLAQLAALRERHAAGEMTPPEFLEELRDWLRGHIRGPDRDFAEFARSAASAATSTRA